MTRAYYTVAAVLAFLAIRKPYLTFVEGCLNRLERYARPRLQRLQQRVEGWVMRPFNAIRRFIAEEQITRRR